MAAQPTPAHPAAMTSEISAQANPSIATATTPDSPIPAPIFSTARLIVRPLHPQDAASMSHHANNPNVTKYMSLSFPSPYTLDSASGWIAMNLAPPLYNWGICERSAPETVIGGVGLKPGADVQSHTAEVGFWIGEEFWGKGFVTEMLRALTEWCFTVEEIGRQRWTRLFAFIFAGNGGSARCFEKCGYAKEGTLKGGVEKNGVASDLHIYGLVKADWETSRV